MMRKPKGLEEMPRLVKEKIVEALEWRDRQKLSEATPSYTHIVDASSIHIDRLFICFCDQSVDIFYYQYSKSQNYTHTVYTPSSPKFASLTATEFAEHVVAELEHLFKNPKLTIDQLVVSFGMPDYRLFGNLRHWKSRLLRYFYTLRSDEVCYHTFFKALTKSLNSLFGRDRKLPVDHHAVYISNESLVPDNFVYFLKYLDPEVLTTYQVESVQRAYEFEVKGKLSEIYVDELVKLPVWSRLDIVQVTNYEMKVPFSDLWRLSRFDGVVSNVTENEVKQMIQHLHTSTKEFAFDIMTPDLSTQAILTLLGRSTWHDHNHWRRYEMEQLDKNLIFQTLGENRFIVYCEDLDPAIDDFDEFDFQ